MELETQLVPFTIYMFGLCTCFKDIYLVGKTSPTTSVHIKQCYRNSREGVHFFTSQRSARNLKDEKAIPGKKRKPFRAEVSVLNSKCREKVECV